MGTKFKVGDKVRRVKPSDWPENYGKVGKEYTVLNVTPGGSINVIAGKGDADCNAFELVEADKPAFKAGDWVRCVDDSHTGLLENGKVYRITRVDSSYVYVDGVYGGMYLRRLEPWTPRVGDRVKMVRERDGYMSGCGATIVESDGEEVMPYLLRFDEKQDWAHRDSRGWWVSADDIEPLIGAAMAPEATAAPLQIVAGRFYKTRDGRKVGPANLAPRDDWGKEWKWDVGLNTPHADDGHYEFGGEACDDDIIAEWPEEAAPVATETKPKFKVGDRVRFRSDYDYDAAGKEATVVKVDVWGNDDGVQVDLGHEGGISTECAEDLEHVTPTAAIVALITNGTPRPATTPKVHPSAEAATKEAERLALAYPGNEYGVFVLAGTHKTERTFDHEWQRLADKGEKIAAIRALRDMAGIDALMAKQSVEAFVA